MELFGKYEVGRLLGCGAFAKVYHGRNVRSGESVAIKVINKKRIAGTNLMSNIKREISIMRRLRHPHIVRLLEVLASKSKIYFILDYVKGGELFAKVAKGRFSEDLARKYFRQLISAVGYCHSRGVFHRDLKPENLLLDENGDLKVSDFGLSAAISVSSPSPGDSDSDSDSLLLRTLCGTPAYVAPEILAKKGYHGSKVDVWSCGVVLFVLTAGYLPFNDPNLMAMYKKIYNGDFKCPKWMSSDLKRFLSRLLDTNPVTRITIDQITRDPWFTQLPSSSFSFYDDDYYLDDDDDDDCSPSPSPSPSHKEKEEEEEGQPQQQLIEGSTPTPTSPSLNPNVSLNAFDLISFSSGLDLSGLFDQSFNPIADGDRFVSAEPAHNIIETIERVAIAHNVGLILKKKKAFGVDLQGPNGNFVAKVDIRPLTHHLVVVQVIKRAGDSASYYQLWKNKLRPLLSRLVYHSVSLHGHDHDHAPTVTQPRPASSSHDDHDPCDDIVSTSTAAESEC